MCDVLAKPTATGIIDGYALSLLRAAPIPGPIVITRGDGPHAIPGHMHGSMEVDIRTRNLSVLELQALTAYLRRHGVRVLVVAEPPHAHLEFYPWKRTKKKK